jgi:class 3 adenylate cyclase
MPAAPDTQYARAGDAHIAYQVASDDGPDLLFVPTASFPIDLLWDEPRTARVLRRLGSFSRLLMSDLLGVGSSDPVPITELPAMQVWTDGIHAVLEAADSESTAIFAASESTLPAILYAATHPERVRALVLWSPYACFARQADQPFGMPTASVERYLDEFAGAVGTGALVDLLAPSCADDAGLRRWWARSERLAAGPGYFREMLGLFLHTDVRGALESIQAPTLILHRRDDYHVRAGHAEELAERIPDARHVELDGSDHEWFAGDADEMLDEVESFLTGERTSGTASRVLSTVLFTDIVDSTKRAAALGDAAWTETLEAHNALTERHVKSYRGSVVSYTGDGVLATFDGPARAIECAWELRDSLHTLDLSIRAGLHTGEIEVVPGGDVRGIAVHLAARVMALAGPDEVFVSGSIPPLVLGSGIEFADHGTHELKGVPEPWPIFAVVDRSLR